MTHRQRLGLWLFIAIAVAIVSGPQVVCAYFTLPQEPSVEWAVEASQLVVRGTVRPGMQREIKGNSVSATRELTLDVAETIKGAPREQVKFITLGQRFAGTERTWVDVLVFLNPAHDVTATNAGSEELGTWEVFDACAFDLGRSDQAMVRMDGVSVSGERLMEATRRAAGYARERAWACEPSSFRGPYSKWVIVPKDRRLEEQARRWAASTDWVVRLDAVHALSEFDSAENIALLRRLMLEDPEYITVEATEWKPRLEERAHKSYPVRSRAASALDILHQSIAGLQSDVPYLRYQVVSWRWFNIGAIALLGIGIVGWRRRGAFAAVICLGLMLAIGLVSWQKRGDSRALSFAHGGADWEVASSSRGFSLLRVQDDAPPHGWMLRRSSPTQVDVWFSSLLSPRQTTGRWGLKLEEGYTTGSAQYSYRLLQSPYWMLIAALALWPLLWTAGRIRRAARRRSRVRRNCCADCGYDLRASGGAGRCPECGAGIHRRQ